ncbi:MAG: phosphoheptose isomerase [Bdellovibrionales bacterium CG12_big_fil_rev_8_21_14_0_65_38_15]|nr:MAG: phosphoheptose isomerase [Bdellovibrionales bacterium CG22_combo_CG10-13_8_21_14_all_38_13]PIQ55011.1 MAG: phosphoheptose isomerase [Bdellovibrionales bacterium CG12_big_fil_rev_8_21_14_0_65_38_15]PIR30962.1 MAG: phosphoheptose isomerase [Bdellovibrionales bacterium CG11_big_fil_rev_8_21_14_0_20_38_13]
MDKQVISSNFTEASRVLNSFISNDKNIETMQKAIEAMVHAYKNEGKVLSCGNGGSMCDAMHFAEELTGRFRKDRPALAALAISDPSHLTCVANDFGYDKVFSRAVEGWGKKDDVLLAISTSGNSPNIIEAVKAAKLHGMKVIGLLGKGGGKLASEVDFPFVIDSDVSDRIQEMHIKLIHMFIEGIERSLFPTNY